MALAAAAATKPRLRCAASWHCHRTVWRGRDDPTGENAAYIDRLPPPFLTGPVDDHTPRIIPQYRIVELIREHFAELDLFNQRIPIGPLPRGKFAKPRTIHKRPVYPPVYSMAFKNPEQPLMVELGCGFGKVLMLLAKRNPDWNYLGLEKNPCKVTVASHLTKALKLQNLHFVYCSATISFDTLLATYPGPLSYVTLLIPDDQRRLRYHDERIIQPPLVTAILKYLVPGGKIFIDSHIEGVADYTRLHFDRRVVGNESDVPKYLRVVDEGNEELYDEDGWLQMNPLGVLPSREIEVIARGGYMYRRLYERIDKKFTEEIPFYKTLTNKLPPIPMRCKM